MNSVQLLINVPIVHVHHPRLLSSLFFINYNTFFQGIPQWRLEKEVTRAMQEVSLGENAHKFAKHLSGGQKRKLSVAIAIIGDPKVRTLISHTVN